MSILRYRFAARAQSVPCRVGDLPLSGRSVELLVIARRFRCDAVLCGRQIFVERFANDVLASSARRTGRLDCIVHHLGLALGGRPAASFARRLMLPVSNDTLLRVVRRRAHIPAEPLNVIGIDDWAWRRNHRYGTIVCDLERRHPVTLLPDREPATATAWLEGHQEITVVARDRVADTVKPLPGRSLKRPRSLIVGTYWRMPAAPFWTPCAKRCARSELSLGRRRSIPNCSLPPSAFNMKAISGERRSTQRSSR
jgi:hypothetical protein